MRKVSCYICRQITATCIFVAVVCGLAKADDNSFYQSNTQYGVSLPNASLPTASDEVRAADGTSCRSAVGGNGAYIDTGIIGAPPSNGTAGSGAFYTRLVVPIGSKPRRLDCSSLYDLEIQRLKMELSLARMGLADQTTTTPANVKSNWQNEGWSSEAPTTPTPVIKVVPTVKKQKIFKSSATAKLRLSTMR